MNERNNMNRNGWSLRGIRKDEKRRQREDGEKKKLIKCVNGANGRKMRQRQRMGNTILRTIR
jgi:hypothetical protein